MSKIEWVDVSSYSRDGPRIPSVWELPIPGLRIRVHRHIDGDPNDWFLSCREMAIDRYCLGRLALKGAQAEALRLVTNHIERLAAELRELSS